MLREFSDKARSALLVCTSFCPKNAFSLHNVMLIALQKPMRLGSRRAPRHRTTFSSTTATQNCFSIVLRE